MSLDACSTALAFAAAAGKLRAAPAARDQVCTSYELFGLDFLVDVGLTPWLLEVNATPSLAVEHQDIAGDLKMVCCIPPGPVHLSDE